MIHMLAFVFVRYQTTEGEAAPVLSKKVETKSRKVLKGEVSASVRNGKTTTFSSHFVSCLSPSGIPVSQRSRGEKRQ